MWKATHRKKVEPLLGQHDSGAPAAWRAIVDRSEDLLSSSVFERLSYLPGTAGIELLLRASEVAQVTFLPLPARIELSEPWPGLDDEGTGVEPDWLLHTPDYTLVVEAKWGRGNVPSERQLAGQHRAARDAHPRARLLHVIVIQSGEVSLPAGLPALIVRWGRLRQEAARAHRLSEDASVRRILGDMQEVMDRRGLDRRFMGSLPPTRVSGSLRRWTPKPVGPRPLPPLPAKSISPEALVPRWT